MANMLISVDEKTEKKIRRLAHTRFGGKKGSISRVVAEAVGKFGDNDDEERKKGLQEFMKKLERGSNFSYKMYKNRNEIYD